MRHRTRHVIAVMVVATALCADRSARASVASPPARGTPSHGFARGFASRITSSFRQSIAPVRMQPARTVEGARPLPLPIRDAATGVRSDFSPFQFRLPPPLR